MKILETSLKEVRAEIGKKLIDKKNLAEYNNATAEKKKELEKPYYFEVAYLPNKMTIKDCQELYDEIDENLIMEEK